MAATSFDTKNLLQKRRMTMRCDHQKLLNKLKFKLSINDKFSRVMKDSEAMGDFCELSDEIFREFVDNYFDEDDKLVDHLIQQNQELTNYLGTATKNISVLEKDYERVKQEIDHLTDELCERDEEIHLLRLQVKRLEREANRRDTLCRPNPIDGTVFRNNLDIRRQEDSGLVSQRVRHPVHHDQFTESVERSKSVQFDESVERDESVEQDESDQFDEYDERAERDDSKTVLSPLSSANDPFSASNSLYDDPPKEPSESKIADMINELADIDGVRDRYNHYRIMIGEIEGKWGYKCQLSEQLTEAYRERFETKSR